MAAEKVWIGTSWKMTKTLAQAREFIDRVASVPVPSSAQPFVLPAHTALAAVRERLDPASPILVGAQNAHWAPEGAWTGEISMAMAADAGARLVELGHSERREHFGETDETVSLKVAAALEHDLVPLICVGESAEVRESGDAAGFVARQVLAALSRIPDEDVGRCLVAYEPVWAIGAGGRPAHPDEVSPVMHAISEVVTQRAGGSLRALLYGGSVNLDNAALLLDDPSTDGLFVGRAAWDPDGFLALLAVGARCRE